MYTFGFYVCLWWKQVSWTLDPAAVCVLHSTAETFLLVRILAERAPQVVEKGIDASPFWHTLTHVAAFAPKSPQIVITRCRHSAPSSRFPSFWKWCSVLECSLFSISSAFYYVWSWAVSFCSPCHVPDSARVHCHIHGAWRCVQGMPVSRHFGIAPVLKAPFCFETFVFGECQHLPFIFFPRSHLAHPLMWHFIWISANYRNCPWHLFCLITAPHLHCLFSSASCAGSNKATLHRCIVLSHVAFCCLQSSQSLIYANRHILFLCFSFAKSEPLDTPKFHI